LDVGFPHITKSIRSGKAFHLSTLKLRESKIFGELMQHALLVLAHQEKTKMKKFLALSIMAISAATFAVPVMAEGVYVGPNGVGVDTGARHDDRDMDRDRDRGDMVDRSMHRDRDSNREARPDRSDD
jgi:hypothetical protein